MARTDEDTTVEPLELDEEDQEEIEDDSEDAAEEQFEMSQQMAEQYGAPIPEEKHNQWTILHKAVEAPDTLRTTFLSDTELGRPLFSVRFYLDMRDICYAKLNPVLNSLKLTPGDNKIAKYFDNKVQNITASGMSNKGFTMNLNVTQRREATKKRIREVGKDGKIKA